MKNSIYIYQHLAIGDNIISNAIIRHYSKLYERVYLFVLPHYSKNIAYMFRDLTNLKLIRMDDSNEGIRNFMKFNPDLNYLVIYIYVQNYEGPNKIYKYFDEGFYKTAGIPYENKWSDFYFQRNIEKEKEVYYNVLNLTDDEEFMFIHEDPANDRSFKPSYFPKCTKTVNPVDFKDISIFDFIYTIEKAKEVHVMNSSFLALIDTMQIREDNIFIHEYAIKGATYHGLKLNWEIIK